MEEQWKSIDECINYEVSSLGRIRNSVTKSLRRLYIGDTGYSTILLNTINKKKNFKVHRLVGMAFIPNPENKPQINHKDFNKQNNCIENLEWVTGKENWAHAVRNKKAPIGQKQIPINLKTLKDPKPPKIATFYQYSAEGIFIQEITSVSKTSERIRIAIRHNKPYKKMWYSSEKQPSIKTREIHRKPRKPRKPRKTGVKYRKITENTLHKKGRDNPQSRTFYKYDSNKILIETIVGLRHYCKTNELNYKSVCKRMAEGRRYNGFYFSRSPSL